MQKKLASTFIVLVIIMTLFAGMAGASSDTTVGASGKYNVGDYSLYANIQGSVTSSPTVVFESGYGDDSTVWRDIQAEVATHALTVSYDRAGLGQSDDTTKKKTAKVQAKALKMLLAEANVPGPYVIVAHSLGGVNARIFADLYPADVAGVVFVDSSHEGQEEALYQAFTEVFPDPTEYAEFITYYESQFTAEANRTTILESYKQGAKTVPRDKLRNVPITVITGGLGYPTESFKTVWFGFQGHLASLSNDNRSVVAENSDHSVMSSEPELVTSEILALLTRS